MLALIGRRFGYALITLWVVSVVVFSAVEMLPGDACQAFLGQMAQGKRLENCRAEHNLSAPAYVRYKDWAVGLAQGDLGKSIKRSKPLEEVIGPRFRNTIILGLTAALIGIPLAPFIHAGFWHTISNTIPLLILGALTLAGGTRKFWEATVTITLLSGVLVWIFAREAYHVGASGLVFGYFGVIMARAVIERGLVSIAIAVVTIMTYGGLLWGVLPLRSYASFESHLFGLIAGIAVIWLNRKFTKSS